MTLEIGGTIDCATPLNWPHSLNRGLVLEVAFVPGLSNDNFIKAAGSGIAGIAHDLTKCPGGLAKPNNLSGTNDGQHPAFQNNACWQKGTTRPGGSGKTLFFFGGTDAVVLGGYNTVSPALAFAKTDSFSGFCWVYSTSNVTCYLLSNYTAGSAPGWAFRLKAGGAQQSPRFALYDAGIVSYIEVDASAAFALNTWTHVGFTYNGSVNASGVALYINGERQATVTNLNVDPGTLASTVPQIANNGAGGAGNAFLGCLDQARVYNRALSDDEARDLYRESIGGSRHIYKRVTSAVLYSTPPTAVFASSESLSFTIDDASAVLASLSVSDTPSWSLSDASAQWQLVVIATTDSPTWVITDASAVANVVNVSDTPTAVITESQSGLLNKFSTGGDALGVTVTDVGVNAVAITAVDSPAAVISDAGAVKALLAVSDSPTAVITDASSSLLFLNRADSPTIIATEGLTGLLVKLPSFDSFAIRLDEFGPITPVAVFLSRADAVAVAVNDASQMVVVVGVSDSPAAQIGDSSAVLVPRAVSDSPTALISEARTLLVALPAQDGFGLRVAELVSIAVALSVSDTPAAGVTDASAVLVSFGVLDSPAAAVADASALTARLSVNDQPGVAIADASALLVMLSASDAPTPSLATTVYVGGHSTVGDYLTGSLSIT